MDGVFAVLLGIALLLTLAVLFAGVITMGRGGEFNQKYGNKLMRWRVMLQGIAVVFFILAMLSRGG
jgi:hypothetical protein